MFEFVPPAPLANQDAKTETIRPAPVAEEQPVVSAPARPRRSWVERLEARMPGVDSAQLPSTAVVRAYHKAGNYVPWEAGLIEWPARVHGMVAVAWCATCTCIAWAGSGAYRQRFRSLWRLGLPGLLAAQLPPLRALRPLPRLWVAWWSLIAWCGLKFWRFPIVLAYLAATVLPIIF